MSMYCTSHYNTVVKVNKDTGANEIIATYPWRWDTNAATYSWGYADVLSYSGSTLFTVFSNFDIARTVFMVWAAKSSLTPTTCRALEHHSNPEVQFRDVIATIDPYQNIYFIYGYSKLFLIHLFSN